MSNITRLEELLLSKQIIVCVGTGGVGKTTLASALALLAARRGRRALVVTIDPARRLADALGLGELGDEPEALSVAQHERLGIEAPGQLSAMMLDMKGTFDSLVDRLAPEEESRRSILDNPIYQHISDALAGSVEYAAMEKVFQLSQRTDFDVIILDTPPAQHALDFLDAPQRLVTLLDSTIIRLLVQPAFSAGRLGFRLFHGVTERTLGLVERLSGVSFLREISEFLLVIDSMSAGFKQRAEAVQMLLKGPRSAFLLVTGPSPATASAATGLLRQLEAFGVELAGVILNRVHEWPDEQPASQALIEGHFEAPPLELDIRATARWLAARGTPNAEAAARAAVRLTRDYALQVIADERHGAPIREAAERGGHLHVSLPALGANLDSTESLQILTAALAGRRSARAGGALSS